MNKLISSKHLEGVSDLTLKAPIKQGFVDAFESVTYETRLRLVMKALFKIRQTAREYSLIKPFVDTAERIQSLLDFRLTIFDDEEPHQLMLSATFDRPFEPYMRLIWNPLGPLLDVIFCNCEGYVTATEHGFEDYLAWVRKSQKDTSFFYTATGLSIDDIQYLTQIERLVRQGDGHFSPTKVVVDNPEEAARTVRKENKKASNQMGMQALVSLYRLADLYPPDQPDGDGKYLLWATQQLLEGWGRGDLEPFGWQSLVKEQLKWFEGEPLPKQGRESCARLTFRACDIQGGILQNYPDIRHGALLLLRITDPEKARRFIGDLEVQRAPCENPEEEAELLRKEEEQRQEKKQAREKERAEAKAAGVELEGLDEEEDAPKPLVNLAFTRHGLVNIGLPACEIERFPQEFREGMEERAGLLLDVRDNHPRRWTLPRHLAPPSSAGAPPAAAAAPVETPEIDIVIQLRTSEEYDNSLIIDDEGHPLHKLVCKLRDDAESGLELLAIEAMRPAAPPTKAGLTVEHFGFTDGLSQPKPVDTAPCRDRDEVPRGDIFLGYSNSRGDPPPPPSTILDNGTFLVLRKLRQDVPALERFLKKACKDNGIGRKELLGKMMGRLPAGAPLAAINDDPRDNKFSYGHDAAGDLCPFQAHIRRTNPRAPEAQTNGRPTPRILRRGMSYGPPVGKRDEPDAAERGILFMAYNASIAEQYEVIQRWVNGGNSTRVASWQNDPLMGVGQAGDRRTFRFEYGEGDQQRTVRIDMEEPFVRLQWGAYLFVPSMAAIKAIAALSPVDAAEKEREAELREARRGEAIVARLLALAAEGPDGRIAAAAGWKTCLEDFGEKDPAELADGPAVWAALRAFHGGVVRVPYGIVGKGDSPPDVVLVASKELVMRVFDNDAGHYSMCGQMARMKQSFGPIFLGLDGGREYDEKSQINKVILGVKRSEAFMVAYLTAEAWLEDALALFCVNYGPEEPAGGRWGELDLRRDFITPVLAGVCNHWFGIPDSLRIEADPRLGPLPKPETKDECFPSHVDPGGWSWEAVRKPLCPGDYMATSRYCFYPDPVPRVQAYGKAQGQALHAAVHAHFLKVSQPEAKLAAEMAKIPAYQDKDEFARTLIGIMTGFLPPADASLRWTLYDWLEERTFWRFQHDLVAAPADAGAAAANAPGPAGAAAQAMPTPDEIRALGAFVRAERALAEPLERAMQKRPSPDMLWRTAIHKHRLGAVDVEDGDRVFVGIVSAMAEDANAGVTDVYPVFGGRRCLKDAPQGEDRPQDKGHPLHACPAYEFAMGTMLGILAALMDKVRVETLPAPLIVRVSDWAPCPLVPPNASQEQGAPSAAPGDDAAVTAPGAMAPSQGRPQEPAPPGTEPPAAPQ
jgi:Dyp-type peroxidase family